MPLLLTTRQIRLFRYGNVTVDRQSEWPITIAVSVNGEQGATWWLSYKVIFKKRELAQSSGHSYGARRVSRSSRIVAMPLRRESSS